MRIENTITIKKHLSAYVLYIFFFCLPFEYLLSTSVGGMLRYIGVIAIIAAGYDIMQSGKIVLSREAVILIVWLLYGAISCVWCDYFAEWQRFYMIYARNACMLLVISFIKYEYREYLYILKSYMLGVVAMLLYILLIPGATGYDTYSGRMLILTSEGIFDPNYMVAVFLVPLSLCIFRLISKDEKLINRLLYGLVSIGIFIASILSGSRGGFLSIIVTVSLVVLINVRSKKLSIAIILFLIAFFASYKYVLLLLPETMQTRFSLESLTGSLDAGASRVAIWEIALNAIKANPIIGYGAGVVRQIILQFGYTKATDCHNTYFELLIEYGILGSMAFFYLVCSYIRNIFKRKDWILFTGAVAVLFASFFLGALTTKFFWGILILISIRSNIIAEEAVEPRLPDYKRMYMSKINEQEETGIY